MGRMRLANMPVRMAAGVFIVNSGVGKLKAGDETAEAVHGMAKGTYPFLEGVPADKFVKSLGVSEVALGSALLLPTVSDGLAGLSLATFAGGLLGMYLRTPGMRQDGSLRPSQQGTAIAKDVWLLGIGLTLMASAGAAGRRQRHDRRAARKFPEASAD